MGEQKPMPCPAVETASGTVRGFRQDGVSIFKGIPYAAAARFCPPEPPPPWTGVRETVALGPTAPAAFGTAAASMSNPDITGLLEGAAEPVPPSEACHVLNVWTPGCDEGRRPVLVWCHGGGFFGGSGGGKWNDGANLARHGDVVVVSFNHRLNILGFLHLGELAHGRFPDAGNAGMLDIVAALRWVRDHIAGFGGDPGNVTVFGQSGGGFKISMLMAVPAAAGLFHKAIVQSGSALRANSTETAATHTDWVLNHLGLSRDRAGELVDMPWERLVEAATALLRHVTVPGENPFVPVVDGRTLARHPFEPDAPAQSAGVPLLVGTTRDESRMLLAGDPANFALDEAAMRARLHRFLEVGEIGADRIIAAFRAARPAASSSDLFFAVTNARMLWMNALTQAERKAAQKAPVFVYRFDWPIPRLGGRLGAPHGVTTPFVFRTTEAARSLVGDAPACRGLSDQVSEAWLAFARTGNPNHAGLPDWPRYETGRRATMIFDETCRVAADPDRAERVAMEAVPPMQI
jgi:para-nitrobenzyl esterase